MLFALASLAVAEAPGAVGQPAPAFTLTDLDGKTVTLDSFRGKTVVLEWFNPGCPYVVHSHGEGPLKDQAARTGEVVWLAINSGAPGKQGHGVETNRAAATQWSMTHPILLDESGTVGKAYGAKTTPHMYVVSPEGTLLYNGAIDNAPMGRLPEGAPYRNHVDGALGEVTAGQAVSVPRTNPYGCSVKY